MENETAQVPVLIPRLTWAALVSALARRDGGKRESGAFLLGKATPQGGKVSDFICYDDVDPDAYQRGAIAFHAAGHAALWAHCKKHGLEVIADAHTHPFDDTRQSIIDQRHPMMPVVGHTALILPHFARTTIWSLRGVGVHEYLGDFKWRQHTVEQPCDRMRLTWW